jgi:hypothetical protein
MFVLVTDQASVRETRRRRFMSPNLMRWSGLAAIVGGLLWIVNAVLTASKLRGCIGIDCQSSAIRNTDDLLPIFLVALLLISFGLIGLVIRASHAGRFGRLGPIGVVFCAAGGALVVIASLIQAIFFGGDFPLMPFFVVPGSLAVIVGFLLLGIAILRARVLPRWVARLLIVGTLAMLGFNDQTAQALLAMPFGISWIAVGYALWLEKGEEPRQPARIQ